jgi:hypothetical protein
MEREHLVVTHVEVRAPNHERIEQMQQEAQAEACLQNNIQLDSCPGVSAMALAGRRRLQGRLGHMGTGMGMDNINKELGALLGEWKARATTAELEAGDLRRQLAEALAEVETLRTNHAN